MIFKNELYKIITDKVVVFLLAVLLCGYVIFQVFDAADEVVPDSMYKRLNTELAGMTMAEKHDYLEEKTFEYGVYEMLAWAMDDYRGLLNDPRASKYIENFQKQGYGLTQSWELYLYMKMYSGELSECEAVLDYPEYIKSIGANAEQSLKMSFFVKPGTFEYKNIERTLRAYERLSNLQPQYSPSQGINQLLNSYIADIMSVLLTITAVLKLFGEERRKGITLLTASMKNGRRVLFINKSLAVFAFAAMVTILFLSAGAAVSGLKYGLGDLSRQIQSVRGFINSTFDISVWQYLALFAVTKLLTLFLVAGAAILLCVVLRNTVMVYGALGAIIGVEFLLYTRITLTSYLAVLGRINPIAFIEVNGIYRSYYNFNIFGEPVNIIGLSLAAMLFALIAVFAAALLFSPKYGGERELPKLMLGKRLNISANLFGHEAYKILIGNKAAVLLAVLAVIAYNNYTGFNEFYTAEELYYHNYMSRLSGVETDRAADFIAEEQLRFDKINEDKQELMRAFSAGEIGETQYNAVNAALTQEEAGINAFYRLKARVDYLQSNGINTKMYYDTGYNKLIAADGYGKDMETSILLAVFLILAVATVFSADNEKGAVKIISTAKNGRGKTLFARLAIVWTVSAVICALAWLPYTVNVFKEYGVAGIDETARSLSGLSGFALDVSVKGYLVALFAVRLLAVLTAAAVIAAVSVFSDNNAASILVCAVFLLIPLLISGLFAPESVGVGFTPLMGGNAVLRGGAVNAIAVVVMGGAVCAVAVRKIVRNR
jgi:hypothetical protein